MSNLIPKKLRRLYTVPPVATGQVATHAATPSKPAPAEDGPVIPPGPITEHHACMGLNSCKDKGYSANNACVGQGDCSTANHSCHTLNDCKGQGGCGLFGTPAEFCHPGDNDCKFQGSCGAPILASRFFSSGENRGLSVWQLARKRFEERMKKVGKEVGPVPTGQEYGPTYEFVQLRGSGSSCSTSGERYDSYSFDNRSRDMYERRLAFMKKSSEAEYSDLDCARGDE